MDPVALQARNVGRRSRAARRAAAAGRLRDLSSGHTAANAARVYACRGRAGYILGCAHLWQGFRTPSRSTSYEAQAGIAQTRPLADRQAVWKEHQTEIKSAEMLGMFLATTGGGLGLLSFGPICEWLGRRKAFTIFHLGGLAFGVLLFQTYRDWNSVAFGILLVLFGFWTLGMHAGLAIYFPELYPTRLRSLGSASASTSPGSQRR